MPKIRADATRGLRSRTMPATRPILDIPDPAARSTPLADIAWLVLGGLAIFALMWTCRGYPLGIPVADDYAFLARRAFHRLDAFDSMGATYYWRPLSRQVYFTALGPALLEARWQPVLIHVAALLSTYFALWKIARRGLAAPVATAAAIFPLVSEPARALLAWPSGGQHLLAGMLAVVAVREAFAARAITAVVAAGLGMLCHESGALALAAIPAIAWSSSRAPVAITPEGAHRPRISRATATLGVLTVGALWGWGYRIALAHGVALPTRAEDGFALSHLPDLITRAVPAALNLEDLSPIPRTAIAIGHVLIVALALMLLIARPARMRLRVAGAFAAGLTWFALGAIPLSQLLPDWNAWRAWLPTLGLGLGTGVALGSIHPGLAVGFAGLRLIALLMAPPGPATVGTTAPATASHMSYIRLVRLQRTVESTRQTLEATHPELPNHAQVRFWNLPRLAEVGFQGSAALRVWYDDSTLTWSRFGGVGGLGQEVDALVEYRDFTPAPAQALEPEAFRAFLNAGGAMVDGRLDQAETGFERAGRATRTRGPFYASIAFNRAWLAIQRHDATRADSLLRVAIEFGEKPDADFWALTARIALERDHREEAIAAVRRCLTLDPNHAPGLEIASILGK